MSFDQQAEALAARVRQAGRGFLTLRREELRERFGIGKLTEGLSSQLSEALKRKGILVHPPPYDSGPSVRLFDERHLLGQIALAVVAPDVALETPLREAADLLARNAAGRDLRSHDAQWIQAFDLLLQVVLGREPEGWEELRDDRHPRELAKQLAASLGFSEGTSEAASTFRVAAAVCAYRPRRRRWSSEDLTNGDGGRAGALLDGLATANARLHKEHEHLLEKAARLLLGRDVVPENRVELGLLGLRYRHEDNDEASRGTSS